MARVSVNDSLARKRIRTLELGPVEHRLELHFCHSHNVIFDVIYLYSCIDGRLPTLRYLIECLGKRTERERDLHGARSGCRIKRQAFIGDGANLGRAVLTKARPSVTGQYELK
jgi:hypothetical protein